MGPGPKNSTLLKSKNELLLNHYTVQNFKFIQRTLGKIFRLIQTFAQACIIQSPNPELTTPIQFLEPTGDAVKKGSPEPTWAPLNNIR